MADQFDTTTRKGRKQLASFFNWWFLSFTVSLLIALSLVTYIQTNVGWILGYAIPTARLLFSIVIFLIGKHTYVILKPQGGRAFVDMAKVIAAAWRKRRAHVLQSEDLHDPPNPETIRLAHTEKFRFLDKAAVITDPISELDSEGKAKNGWRLCNLHQVEQLKLLLGMVPVWLTGICFFILIEQQNSIWTLQAPQMNKFRIGSQFTVPQGWLNTAGMIILSLNILLYERIYVPLTKKMTGKERRLTIRQRINIGIMMSILCPVVAGIVEKRRREEALKRGTFESPLSMLWLLPQFGLLGLVESFAAVAVMEFLTMKLPETMRTVSGAIYFLTVSLGSYLNTFLLNIIHKVTFKYGRRPWYGDSDLNKDNLDYFYFLMAGIGALNFLYFNLFAKRYASTNSPKQELNHKTADNDMA